MLKIKNLQVSAEDKAIINGLDLQVAPGEVHAIMGQNGSGKSTLANVMMGNQQFSVTGGSIEFFGASLLDDEPDERAARGVFMAFQYPVEIAGVTTASFLRQILNAQRKRAGQAELDAIQMAKHLQTAASQLQISREMLQRPLNFGFSGGEKKRLEILQLHLLAPKLAILDETDSGLDIDALQTVAKAVNAMRSSDRSFLIITHYQRLLQHIVPDHIHVMDKGKIIKSGGAELALQLESGGYAELIAQGQ